MAKKETVRKPSRKTSCAREDEGAENALAQLNKTMARKRDEVQNTRSPTPTFRSSQLLLDWEIIAPGVGGLPPGARGGDLRPESSGKTTMACTAGPRRKGRQGIPSSTPSTRWTRSMPRSWASISTISISPSLIPASRRWRSARRWCAPARWTSWSSTPWPRSCPRPRSRATWATTFSELQARLMRRALRKLTGVISGHQRRGHLYQSAPRQGRHNGNPRDPLTRAPGSM